MTLAILLITENMQNTNAIDIKGREQSTKSLVNRAASNPGGKAIIRNSSHSLRSQRICRLRHQRENLLFRITLGLSYDPHYFKDV